MLSSTEVADLKAALAMAQVDIAGWTHGTFLRMADRATHTNYSVVGQVLKICGLNLGGEKRDVTNALSAGWLEFLNVEKTAGKLVFEVHFLRSESTLAPITGLLGAALEQTVEYFDLTFSDGAGLSFGAFVEMEFTQPVNARLVGKVTLGVTGAVSAF